MKKITKSFLLSTCFLFELATFTHATRISELCANEDVLHLCKLVEKLINFNYNPSELNEILKPGAFERYCMGYIRHNDKDFYDCCRFNYTIYLLKDILLEEDDDALAFRFFLSAFGHRIDTSFFISRCITDIEDISQDDIDFLNSPFLMRITKIKKEIASKYSRINPSDTQQAPKKSSCTIL